MIAGRDEIHVLQRQINRAQSTETDRTILAVLVSVFDRRRLADVMRIMQPATVLGRHRRLVARQWTQPPARKRGRPPIADRRSPIAGELRKLVRRLATGNPTWGYRRVHGELCGLGHRIAASSVWNILHQAAINPAPHRTGPWTTHTARNLLMGFRDDHGFRYLIRDGAGQFTAPFDTPCAADSSTSTAPPPEPPPLAIKHAGEPSFDAPQPKTESTEST